MSFGLASRAGCCCALLLAAVSCGSSTKDEAHAETLSEARRRLPTACENDLTPRGNALVDDFEDGDLLLSTRAAFHGVWFVTNDATGEQVPTAGDDVESPLLVQVPGAPQSQRGALHTRGADFSGWGAIASGRLNESRSGPCTVNLSSYTGLSLRLKGSGALRVNVGTVATTPIEDGGDCHGDKCSDFGRLLEPSADWQSVSVAFSELSQPAWATPAAWEPEHALRVAFWIEAGAFDFWIDDVAFY